MDYELHPKVLVLGPGGMKGFLELGALKYLEEDDILKSVDKIIGCSIGSIIGLLLIVGYTVQEITLNATSVNLFGEIEKFSLGEIKDHVGLISNDVPKIFLEKAVKSKCDGEIPTLQQLFNTFEKDLITTSVNLNLMETHYFSKENDPDLSCIDAVLLSINIPLLFYQLLYKEHIYIDGAFKDPYPIDIFDDRKTIILGIYIKSDFCISSGVGIVDYCYRVVQLPIDAIYEIKKMNSSKMCYHILLKTHHLDMTGGTYEIKDMLNMYVEGYNECKRFIGDLRR